MKLPNASRAVVDARKLYDYCLNPEHPRGKHKARVFRSVLGLTVRDAELLRAKLLEAVQVEEAEPGRIDAYGKRYTLDFEVKGRAGPVMVRSARIVRHDESVPRLVSCFVL